jgi:hypothetical protein
MSLTVAGRIKELDLDSFSDTIQVKNQAADGSAAV